MTLERGTSQEEMPSLPLSLQRLQWQSVPDRTRTALPAWRCSVPLGVERALGVQGRASRGLLIPHTDVCLPRGTSLRGPRGQLPQQFPSLLTAPVTPHCCQPGSSGLPKPQCPPWGAGRKGGLSTWPQVSKFTACLPFPSSAQTLWPGHARTLPQPCVSGAP